MRYQENTPEKALAFILQRIGNKLEFGGRKWNDIINTLPRNPINSLNHYTVDDSKLLNYILAINNPSPKQLSPGEVDLFVFFNYTSSDFKGYTI